VEQEFDESGAGLQIGSATMNYEKDDGASVVTTLGTIKNPTSVCVKGLVVEVKYFDDKRNLVDVATEPLYGIVISPLQEVAFRVRETAARAKDSYATVAVRVVAAEQRVGRPIKSNDLKATVVNFLTAWGPMLLIIAVFLFYMVRASGKSSPGHKMVALSEAHASVLTRQVEALERLAVAAEQSVKEPAV